MARSSTALLDAGDAFPHLKFRLVDGPEIEIPGRLERPWNVVLFNRGHWCPYCVAQLTSFQNGLERLTAEGIGVIAASVDDIDHARDMKTRTGATFPIGYGLPVIETAAAIGAFYDPAPNWTAPYIQSTGFLLGPDNGVVVSVYSSGAIGRLVWQDVLALVRSLKNPHG
ncbi:MAG: peroxiredoxin family protein [Gemmatimonadales bacterium]